MRYLVASLMIIGMGTSTGFAASEQNHMEIDRTGASAGSTIGMSSIDLDSDLGQVVRTVYAEARGESVIEKQAVANVIRNRVESGTFPRTYKGVVTQPYQFSALLKSDPNRPAYENPVKHAQGNKRSQSALKDAVEASISALFGTMDITQGATLYYSPRSMKPAGALPKWDFSKLEEVKIPGVRASHFRFFRERGYVPTVRVDWLANLCKIFPVRPLIMKPQPETQPVMAQTKNSRPLILASLIR